MARPQTPALSGSTALRPVAAPTDMTPRPNGQITELLRALSSLNPELARFGKLEADKEYDTSYRAALISKAETLQEAIDKGEVSFGSSEIAQKAWQAGKGRNFGDGYFTRTLDDFHKSDLFGSGDVQAVQKWLADRRAQALQGQSQDFLEAALPRMEAADQQIMQVGASEFHQRVEEETEADLGESVMQSVVTLKAQGMSDEGIAAKLQMDNALPKFAGMSGKRINAITVQAVIAAAENSENPKLLDILSASRPDLNDPKKKVKGPASIPEFAIQIDNARERIESRQLQRENAEYTRQLHADKTAGDALMREAVQYILNQPKGARVTLPADLLARMNAVDPDIVGKAQTMIGTIQAPDRAENPIETFSAWDAIRKSPNKWETLGDQARAGRLSAISVEKIANDLDNTYERDNPSSVFRVPGVKDVQDRLLKTLADRNPMTGALSGLFMNLDETQAAQAINEAMFSFNAEMKRRENEFQATQKRPMNPLEAQSAANEVSAAIIKTMKAKADGQTAEVESPKQSAEPIPTNPRQIGGKTIQGTNVYRPRMIPYQIVPGRTLNYPMLPSWPTVTALRDSVTRQQDAIMFDQIYGPGAAAKFLAMTQQQYNDYTAHNRPPPGAKRVK